MNRRRLSRVQSKLTRRILESTTPLVYVPDPRLYPTVMDRWEEGGAHDVLGLRLTDLFLWGVCRDKLVHNMFFFHLCVHRST